MELVYEPFVHDIPPELEVCWIEDEHVGAFLQETESRRQLRTRADYPKGEVTR